MSKTSTEKSTNKEQEISQHVLSRNRRIEELSKKHGVESINDTREMLGKTSIVFMPKAKPKPTSSTDAYEPFDDSAETSLRYLNQMKSQHPSRKK